MYRGSRWVNGCRALPEGLLIGCRPKRTHRSHRVQVEELLLSGKSIQEADKLAYQMVPNDGPIGHSQRHAQMQQQRQQPRM